MGEDISRVMGIINGATNFLLTKMSQEGADYADALAGAQALGYAEADPTADVEGYDAGAKAAIADRVRRRRSIQRCAARGRLIDRRRHRHRQAPRLRHQGARRDRRRRRVAVECIRRWCPPAIRLANVNDSFNAVFVEGATVGDLMFYGSSAGGGQLPPPSSAISSTPPSTWPTVLRPGCRSPARLRSVDELSSQFYLTMVVSDEPGVLAQVATVFGIREVSIQVMEQSGTGGDAERCLILHETTEAASRDPR